MTKDQDAVEVLPPARKAGRSSKTLAILPARNIEERGQEIIRHHEAARQHLAQSAVHAALAGLELQAARTEIPHGQFQKWVEDNFVFNADTASRYMRLADGIKRQISKASHVTLLEDIFSAPPSELSKTKRDQLISTLAKATGDQTLRQMYLDFGILKEPKPTGGYNGRIDRTPEERLKIKRAAAIKDWGKVYDSILNLGIKEPLFIELKKAEILTLVDLFKDVVRAMEAHLKEI